MKIELYIHAVEGAEPKRIEIADDATIDDLLKVTQATDVVSGEPEEELLLLVENEEKRVRRGHKLRDHHIAHTNHVHFRRQHIEVAVVTTSGVWPPEGFDRISIHQAIKVELHRAAEKLGITDTANWIAKVGTQELNIEKSYQASGLKCKVEIDYGPREGGGGNE